MRPFLLLAFLLLIVTPAHAQSAADRVFPPGGQRGTTVTLTFPTQDKVEAATLVVDGDGLRSQGPFVKGVGKIEIAPDAEPGVRQIRLVGPKAATAPRPFAVGTLPEVLEKEPNDTFEQAQRLEKLPLTLNGAIPKPGDTDNYSLTLKKGDFLVVASESRRLAGPVYLELAVRDLQGRSVPVDVDNRKRDPVFTCAIPADGDYYLQLADVTSNMGNVDEGCQYRLHITTGPWLDFAVAPSAQRGGTAHLTLHGWNLGGKSGPGAVTLDQPIPAHAPDRFSFSAAGAPNRVPLFTGAEPEGEEREPNDTREAAQELSLPAVVHGTFGRRGDADCFRFNARAKEQLRIEVQARELDSLADPRFTLFDSAGKQLLYEDDTERTRDPRTVWTAPADGVYTLVLQDLAGNSRGGPGSYYRLSIGPVQPELSIVAAEPTATVKPGAKSDWSFTIYQAYQPGAITLHVEGLPAGVTAAPVTVQPLPNRYGQSQAKLTLTAAPDAKPGFGVARVVATTADGLTREAVWMITGDGGVSLGTGASTKLVVLVPAS